jgi:hypothetical protein
MYWLLELWCEYGEKKRICEKTKSVSQKDYYQKQRDALSHGNMPISTNCDKHEQSSSSLHTDELKTVCSRHLCVCCGVGQLKKEGVGGGEGTTVGEGEGVGVGKKTGMSVEQEESHKLLVSMLRRRIL